MKSVRLLRAGVVTALVTTCLVVPAGTPASAAGDTLVVNAGSVLRPVTHVGAGGLYALATATTPTPSELPPLHLNQLVQPAPGVQQLGNGATTPTGDVLKVAPTAINAGARMYVRMPDIYPNFPYRWVSWSDWLSKLTTMVNARLAATTTTNIDGWELWNEPDWTWNTTAAGSFNAGWTRTFQAVRALDSITPIVGPSISVYNHAWMLSFLTNAKATNTLPNVLSWHQLTSGQYSTIAANVADAKAIESSLGISPLPISIDEYAATNEVDVPSGALHYLADFERFRVGFAAGGASVEVVAGAWVGAGAGQAMGAGPQQHATAGILARPAGRWLIAGELLFDSAISDQSSRSKGLAGALRTVAGQPFGAVLLVIVAIGFAAFGVYCFAQSKYRKI